MDELLRISKKAADAWRNDAAYYQAAQLIDALCDRIAHGVTFATDTNVGSKWISVEDRLPEDLPENRNKKVINCIVAHPRGGSGRLESQFRQRKWDRRREEWYWSKIGSYTVTHWMPLPEPPKEEPK